VVMKQWTWAGMMIAGMMGFAVAVDEQPRTEGGAYRRWLNVRIDGGGFVSGLIEGPARGGSLYVRTDVGGAYRWLEKSGAWLPITDNVAASRQIESLATDPVDPGRVYVAAGGKMLRSDDRGGSWKVFEIPARMSGNGEGRSMGERLAVDPYLPRILFFGSRRDGLLRSEDAGETWRVVEGLADFREDPGIGFVLFDPRSGTKGRACRTIYVGGRGATACFYRSTDGGTTWQAVAGQPPPALFPHHAVRDRRGRIFMVYGNAAGPNGITDGAVWRHDPAMSGDAAWCDISPLKPGTGSGDHFGYASLALDPHVPDRVVVGSIDRWAWHDAMWMTTNAAAVKPDWTVLFSGKVKPKWISPVTYKVRDTHWIGDAAFHPSRPDQFFFAGGQGAFRTDNLSAGTNAVWTFSSYGLEETVVLDLASPSEGPRLLSGLGDIGGFVHASLATSPTIKHSDANTTGVDVAGRAPAVMARVGNRPASFSVDGGATWQLFPSLAPGKNGDIAVSADGAVFLWSPQGAAVQVSRDRGASWTPVEGLPAGCKIAADRVNGAKFYAFDSKAGALFASTDGGVTFVGSATRVPGTHGYLRSAIRAVPGREGHVFVSTQNWQQLSGLHRSIDSGLTFAAVSGYDNGSRPLTANHAVRALRAFGFGLPLKAGAYPALYAAGKINADAAGEIDGIFRSDDAGASWVRINDDAHRFGVDVIVGDGRTPGRVYLGTDGRGIICGEP